MLISLRIGENWTVWNLFVCYKKYGHKNMFIELLPGVVGVLFLLDGDHTQDRVGVLVVEREMGNSEMLQIQSNNMFLQL